MTAYQKKIHILVIDDDDRIRTLLSRFLNDQGYVVSTANCAEEAKDVLSSFVYDILVVDVMMPGQDGFSFGKYVRSQSDVPIIFLTARTEIDDKMEGYEAGADDYLSKPFDPKELVMRIEAILKRRGGNKALNSDSVTIGPWQFKSKTSELVNETRELQHLLTDVEVKLLSVFLNHRGEVISREQLVEDLGFDTGSERTIDVQVTRLRKKLEKDPKKPRILQTVRGKGYILHE